MEAAIQFDQVSRRFTLRRERARSLQETLIGLVHREKREKPETIWALRNISFTIAPGETVGFIGENGAGKSTILKLVSRVLEPTSGRIAVNGRVGALLELGAGFHPDLTGRENIYLNGSILGLGRREIEQSMDEIVAFSELERFIDIPVKRYSSGMYMRLGFSVAVHVNPDILLIDEVLAVGDQNFQHKCMDRVVALQQQGTTICFVSHDLGTVARICSRAFWLDDGLIRAEGDPDDVVGAYLRHAAAQEEQATSRSQKEEQAERRWGTGEVEITDVAFLDGEGRERTVFRVGEPWAVRIRYLAHRRIESPVFGLAVHRNDGVHVCGPNTHFAGLDIPFIEGEGEVLYRVDRMPLMEGTYFLSLSAHNQLDTAMYDYHDRLYTFRVRQVQGEERYGLASLQGRWEWHGDEARAQ